MQIIELQYIGSLNQYLNLINVCECSFSLEKPYEKGSHLNRTWLMGPNKILSISVPLAGGRDQKKVYRDVRIAADHSWCRIHWRTIHDSYKKAPWFDEYAPELEPLIMRPSPYLWELNLKLTQWVSKVLIGKNVSFEEVKETPEKSESQLPVCEPISAVNPAYPRYHQLFESRFGFVANLSALDLIFNEGPASSSYLSALKFYHLENESF